MSKPTPGTTPDPSTRVVNVGDRIARLDTDKLYARTVTRLLTGGDLEVAIPGDDHHVVKAGSYRIF